MAKYNASVAKRTILFLFPILCVVTLLSFLGAAATNSFPWEQAKREDALMARDFLRYYKSHQASAKDQKQLAALVDKIWTLMLKTENEQKNSRDRLAAEINRKTALALPTSKDLQNRLDAMCTARLNYLYANSWRRIMREGFENTSPGISRILGKRIDVVMSKAELDQIMEKHRFDPSQYSLPDDFFHKDVKEPRF